MKRSVLFIILLFSCIFTVIGSDIEYVERDDMVVQGYMKSCFGTSMNYYSHLGNNEKCLIIRAKNGMNSIEWDTEVLPVKLKSKYLTIVWVGGVSGQAYGKTPVPLDLSVNGRKVITFMTGKTDSWTVKGSNGIRLSFERLLKDGSDDCFGYMYLRVPRSLVSQGKSVKLKISSDDLKSESWSMVFKKRIPSGGFSAKCLPAILKKGQKQVIGVSYNHFGSIGKADLIIDGKKYNEELKFGDNRWELLIDPVKAKRETTVKLVTDSDTIESLVVLNPCRHWKTKFMQITHTDIGYTRPQAEILAEHIRFIDYVLDYCDATDEYPDDAKFRWTCEGTWAVNEYMKSRPQSQIDRLIRRIKEGRIELTGMYYNFDEIPSEQTLAASLSPLSLFHDLGLNDIQVATQNDVNGIGWCFTEFFPSVGIKYLTMGVNLHKAIAPFDHPTYFWWVSPSGKRILAYYGEHYMHGNYLGVNGKDFVSFEKNMLDYLNKMDSINFKFDIVACEFLGIGGDNSAPSTFACDIVKQWNEKYEWPKIRLSLYKDYFNEVESRYGNDIPEIKRAWPDWWTDGFASGAAETAAHRITQGSKVSTMSGLALAQLLGSNLPENIYSESEEIDNALLFYGEHTYGADASINAPFSKETMEQRNVKASYAWEGLRRERLLKEKSLGFLNEYVSKSKESSIVVFNTSSWNRTGLVDVYIDFSILPLGKDFKICDGKGREIKAQMLNRRHDGATWSLWVKDIPAYSYRKYYIYVSDDEQKVNKHQNVDFTIDNEWYSISIDSVNGTILSLFDKELNKNIIDNDSKWKTGQFIHERTDKRYVDGGIKNGNTRKSVSNVRFLGYTSGDIWDTYSFAAYTEAGAGKDNNLYIDYRIYNVSKRVDVFYSLNKSLNISPEAAYVSFPFNLLGGGIYFDVPGGVVQAGVDQIPGTSNDWNTVQNFTTIKNDSEQIIFVSPEVPMVELGNINNGRFQKNAKPESNHVFSYVMNNYWTTNFNATQHGEFKWSYCITSMKSSSDREAMTFALECRNPMLARVLPANDLFGESKDNEVFLSILPKNTIVMNMTPMEDNSILLQLREMDGLESKIEITSDVINLEIEPSNVLGESVDEDLTIKPFETKFIKIISK